MKKWIFAIILTVLIALAVTGCSDSNGGVYNGEVNEESGYETPPEVNAEAAENSAPDKIPEYIVIRGERFDTSLTDIQVSASTDRTSDEQIKAAYAAALEAMIWFHVSTSALIWHSPPPPPPRDPDIPSPPPEPITWPEDGAFRVHHPTISTQDDLRNHLLGLFSREFAERMLPVPGPFFDRDGVLYGVSMDRGTDPGRGNETHEIIRVSDTKIIYRLTVEVLADLMTVTDYAVYDMIYEYIDGRWVFTQFELVR